MVPRIQTLTARVGGPWSLVLGVLGVVVSFLFAVQLLGTATAAAAPLVERVLARLVVGDAAALGLGWLGASVLANGSVVAALAVSLFAAEIVTAPELFLLVAGSRLGAASVVVLVGVLDFLQKERYSLPEAVEVGLLTFLLTHSVYLPATLVGYLALPLVGTPAQATTGGSTATLRPLSLFEPAANLLTAWLGPGLAVVLAVGVLFGSLRLFDRLLASVETATLRARLFRHFRSTRLSFLAGLLVTVVTTSVAFSLGVVVPLYNRGYVEREELVPYVLGANLGTLFDTLAVAVLLDSPAGVAVVLVLLGVASLLTGAALLAHDAYSRVVLGVDDRLLTDRRAFVAFGLALVFVPLLLVGGSLVVG
ncbi:sodium:phosphate symporter [Salinirubellus salinus]|uniref:Sodium:phosphate symporter n=1 Tax=Salinirubellus salinus TaxID=1364945 RepID=A0A9E7R0B5_9EURY|nr:sodium:phosphate symporter [Salinirubellus salinus]UWM53324.1 sodium:phosphate symporter [Salinirubellus salinus]